jgi:hypothetical protein
MKSNLFLTCAVLLASVLSGCNRDNTAADELEHIK